MRPRVWSTTATLSLLVTAALLLATSPPAGAGPRPGLTIGPSGLLPSIGLPLPSLPPLPTPTLPLPTGPTGGVPTPTPTRPTPTRTTTPPAVATPTPTTATPAPAGITTPDGAAALIADDPGASLYPQPPAQPPDSPGGRYADRLAAVQQRIQYLHNVLTRTAADLAVAQREAGAVPQLIDGLTGPATPAQARAADTPAGRVAALAAAVASGQAELSRREAEAASLQQLITGQLVTTAAAPTRLLRPVQGTLTSRYGNRLDPYYHVWQLHPGIDLAAPLGTPIYAAGAGRVTQAGWYGGYGNYTCIAHGTVEGQSGVSTCYGHQSRILVTPGQQVGAGQLIGLVGSTGASTGPHLHFEVRIDGRPVDPLPWLG